MPITDFTYIAYKQLLDDIHKNGYNFADYHNYENIQNPCILRHDIDFDINRAYELARFEERQSVQSTYFVLINTNFYNVFSSEVNIKIKEMITMGHEIGLHFDEIITPPTNEKDEILHSIDLIKCIKKEIDLLESIIEYPVRTVSMHRPSQFALEANIAIPNVINAYSHVFTKEFKYISDSRCHWREDVESIISSRKYKSLHVLTHPFWYTENKESCKEKLLSFIGDGNRKRYNDMNNNFRNLDEFLRWEDFI